jgi:hypothetical protein
MLSLSVVVAVGVRLGHLRLSFVVMISDEFVDSPVTVHLCAYRLNRTCSPTPMQVRSPPMTKAKEKRSHSPVNQTQKRRRRWNKLTVDPNPDAAIRHEVSVVIDYPTFGRPSDDIKVAQSIKNILKTGLHSQVTVTLVDQEGNLTPIPDRDWSSIE